MRLRLPPLLTLLLLTGACRATPPAAPDPGRLDAVARRYVVLGLGLGAHDPAYVDAYYGPDSLRVAADSRVAHRGGGPDRRRIADRRPGRQRPRLRRHAGPPPPPLPPRPARRRWRRGRGCWAASGSSFDQEAAALYDATPPHYSDAHFDSLLARLDSLLPGQGTAGRALPAPPRRRDDPGGQGGHGVQDRDRRVPGAHARAHARSRRASASTSST